MSAIFVAFAESNLRDLAEKREWYAEQGVKDLSVVRHIYHECPESPGNRPYKG